MSDTVDAPVIRSDEPGSFARSVLAERHPALIEKVRDAFPYGPGQHRALDALRDNAAEGTIAPLPPTAYDHDRWAVWGREHFGRSWFDVPFLWAESYFYRRLLEAVGYFADGPWRGVDPFRPFKQAELDTPDTEAELATLDDILRGPAGEQADALVHGSLWGNRADLGFRISSSAADTHGGDTPPLVADDSEALWSLLPAGSPATLCVVADNAGRELLPDLVLIDHVLHHGRAERVVLQVKPYPYYVSDATTEDVVDCLRRLVRAEGAASATGGRLWAAMSDGRLTVRAHDFFRAPLPYEEMPGDLRSEFAAATLTVMKGDLNYRRLVGDRLWPPTTPFADRTGYFPGPVAALRTLKSDVIVGLDGRTVAALDAHEDHWRTSGAHALIQVRR
ncbi:damage-control phosphatase ARMT1 family protein [Streptomyces rhizosphaericus]|uniref:Protein-glutamate O-methyltransferase family protein n=1 Tax=Streptomyces rhizosphaericus TaxID=114699 RepID=A0A6G4A9J9_9ACTN|nr:damage-control phosphatase ARMT1 family protein [Streptomyces rhizosphaericus]NEW69514.1 protein-glutamate O-methyltransferase family protein [Streptomyces rhizosphaericus]